MPLAPIVRRAVVTGVVLALTGTLAACSSTSEDDRAARAAGATADAAASTAEATSPAGPTASSTAPPARRSASVGRSWLLAGTDPDSDDFLTWELDTLTGTLRLVNVVDRYDHDWTLVDPTSITALSGDGHTTFGPVPSGGTTVTVAGTAGGTGDLFDITTLPDLQPGDVVHDVRFDLTTPSSFDVQTRESEDGRGPGVWWRYDADDPTAAPVRVDEPADPDAAEPREYPWGTADPDDRDVLTLTTGEQWQVSATTNSVTMFRRTSAHGDWQKVGLSGQVADERDPSGVWWFRPKDVTDLVG